MDEERTSQEVGYSTAGPADKQCANCKNYKSQDADYGDCFGHKVVATGSCNYFTQR